MKNKHLNDIETLMNELKHVGIGHSGSLSEQYNVCGKETCRCKDKTSPQRHGPYYQLSYFKDGKHTTKYIKKSDVGRVKQAIENHQKIKQIMNQIKEASVAYFDEIGFEGDDSHE